MARRAVAFVRSAPAFGRLQIAAAKEIDRPHQYRTAGSFYPTYEALCTIPRVGHVELIPGRSPESFSHILDRRGCRGGEHLYSAPGASGARDGQLSLGME